MNSAPRGSRIIPLEKFFLLPEQDLEKENTIAGDEIVSDILLPPPVPGGRSSYRKVRARQSWDFALAGVALAFALKGNRVETARLVLSGAAPVPWRSREAEEIMTGKVPDGDTVRQAAEAAIRNAEPLKHNGHKVSLFRGVLEEELTKIIRA